MKISISNIKAILIFGCFVLLAIAMESPAATITSQSCAYGDVLTAIKSASAGDTIIVPAGNAIWDSQLIITKGITLQGAGVGNTVITSNYIAASTTTATANFLIVYNPAVPIDNDPFRITGFTWDMNNSCSALKLINTTTIAINKIRVDHNAFFNSNRSGTARMILISGTVFGVIDNNIIKTDGQDVIDSYGNDKSSWDNLTFSYGSADNIYYEDNTFTINNSPHMAGVGGRYCARFNTYTSSAGLYPFADMHGNMGVSGNYSTMGAEIYGNNIISTSGIRLLGHRGGKALVFNNKTTTPGFLTVSVREEVLDSLNATTNKSPQHVSDSYYWNNINNSKIKATVEQDKNYCGNSVSDVSTICDEKIFGYSLKENREWFQGNSSFDGTSGIGTGPIASRPTTCATGVAYWATDVGGDWNKINDTSNDGALYKCTAINEWTLYYTPYTYPHPLRAEVKALELPGAPSNLIKK
jgi:hypothetical protein